MTDAHSISTIEMNQLFTDEAEDWESLPPFSQDDGVSVSTSVTQKTPGSILSDSDTRAMLSRGIITLFPTDGYAIKWELPETYFGEETGLNNWCGQWEVCPETKRDHLHVYYEFQHDKRPRFSKLLSIVKKMDGLPGACNVARAGKASAHQRGGGVNYVTDERKRKEGTRPFIWSKCKNPDKMVYDPKHIDTRPKKKSKDDKDEEIRLYIETKPRHMTWDQIVHESMDSKKLLFGNTSGKAYHAGRFAEEKRRLITNVIIAYGAGGTGKTTMAAALDEDTTESKQERYYRRNYEDGNFWGGGRTAYKGQKNIHMEEFSGQETFSRVKELMDVGKEGPSVNIKQSGTELNHDTIIFTSNTHPAGWYNGVWGDDPKQFHPFWRRVTRVVFFPPVREDGSLNIPDDQNPPYTIDQTEEWKAMAGDYDQCKLHAAAHWALKEVNVEEPNFAPGFNQRSAFKNYESYARTGSDPTRKRKR
jgi:hypothetical protein|tara:strand:- start:4187 stop:5611 length:1425 start_codon:yes stop_codon:yes gene_type:complete